MNPLTVYDAMVMVVTMSEKENKTNAQQAIDLHQMEGYNCAQAIIATYSPIVGYDLTSAYRFSEGFGSGTGRLQGMCGVISAVTMILGYINSNALTDSGAPRSKATTYKITSQFTTDFSNHFNTIICGDLKRPQSPTYTPCIELIRFGCAWLDHYLNQIKKI